MIKQITTLKDEANQKVWALDWHPKQKLLAAVGSGRNISLWKQLQAGKWGKTESLMTQHLKTIRSVKFSNKGDKIAVCSFDTLISVYILNEGKYEFLSELQGHQNQVKSIDWHESDKKIASCGRDTHIWIWGFNPTTYEYQCQNVLQGHQNDVKCVKWIDYNTLASCSYDNTIRIWTENDDDFDEFQVLKNHQSIVWSLDYQEGYLISVSSDMSAVLFKRDQESLKFSPIRWVENLHQQPIYTVCLIYPYFLTGGGDNCMKLLKIESQNKANQVKIAKIGNYYHENDVNCIRFKKNKKQNLVASCSDDGTIKLWTLIV